MFVCQFRADQSFTSQITSAVWIDTSLLRVSLVPGATEPGGVWPEPPNISGPALTTAVAAFNGGFRFQDAHGGFYLDGRQAVPLRTGAASLVIYASGKVDIGIWGSEVTMTPDVRAVLQNLVPIVDNGQPAAAATYSDHRLWGATLGANTVVARSGVGVTASGALVYVAGPASDRPKSGRVAAAGRGGQGHGAGHQSHLGHLQLLPARRSRGDGDQALPPDATAGDPVPGADARVTGLFHDLAPSSMT